MDGNLAVVVLAAGHSTRFKSRTTKVLHELCGKPMIEWVLDSVVALKPSQLIVVHGQHNAGLVERYEAGWKGVPVQFALQDPPAGTADALLMVRPLLAEDTQRILLLQGDAPLLTPRVLRDFIAAAGAPRFIHAVLTTHLADPSGYGRIQRGEADTARVARIIEQIDCDADEALIREVNTGVYLFDSFVFDHLEQAREELGAHCAKGEYFLPDIVQLAPTLGVCVDDELPVPGVKNRLLLAQAEGILLKRLREHWMREGVTFRLPETVYMHADVQLAPDVEIGPHCVLTNGTTIGSGTTLIQGCYLEDCTIGENCTLLHVRGTEAEIHDGVRAGPYVNLRPGTILREGVKVGNFVETKKADIGARSKLPHLQYIGDATLGEDVNIGAGTIFCNYDGFEKHHTTLGDRVFIGSNSSLSAPLNIGADAYVAMGSAITKDIPAGALGIARARQENKEGYVEKLRAKLKQRRAQEAESAPGENQQ
jgi:bifunctional UDP-N-acetylglucosamine pyrophosphorylase / glucosamine-1-phosphate N-acetyltransferase